MGLEKSLRKSILLSTPAAKIGVLGRNGTGKSTLLRIMAGQDTEFDGEARLTDGFTCGYLPQEPQLNPEKDVWGNVEEAVAPRRAMLDRYNQISVELAEPMDDEQMMKLCDEMARLQDEIETTNTWNLDREIEVAFDVMNLPDRDADVTTLSGESVAVWLSASYYWNAPTCYYLTNQRTILMPIPWHGWNDIWATTQVRSLPSLTIVISWITLPNGFLNLTEEGYPFEGNYTAWLEQKEARLKIEEKQSVARQKTIARELEWVRSSPKARQSKSKARIAAYDRMVSEQFEEQISEFEMQIPPGAHLGDLVIEAKNISKGFGDKILMEDLSFSLPAGGIVGVIGPNGAGKTTLFRMLTEQDTPDSGELRVGPTVEMGYVDQNRDNLDPAATVYEEISGGYEHLDMGGRRINSRGYVSRFNFKGPDQEKKVGTLSGGERNRVHLAKLLRQGSNVLLLDEPTNDLDVDTLRALEEAIQNYAGCVVVTSHDRWFLDRLATHILAFEGDGYVHWCEGNYETYERQRRERLGINPDEPRRFKYKKLV